MSSSGPASGSDKKKRTYRSDKQLASYFERWDRDFATDVFVMEFKASMFEAYALTKKGTNLESPLYFFLEQFDLHLSHSGRAKEPWERSPDDEFETKLMIDFWENRRLQAEAVLYELREMLQRTIAHLQDGKKNKKKKTS